MESKWPYSCCFEAFCFQDSFKTECLIHKKVSFRYGCSLEEFPFYFIRRARFAMPSNSCSLSWVVCKMGSKWPYSSCFVTFCFQELFKTECMIHNNIRYGCSLEEFPFYFIRGARFAMPSNSCSLSWVVCKMGSKWPYSSCFVTFCFQELFKTECMIHNNIRYGCSLEEFPFYFIRGARFAMPSNCCSLSWVVCKMGSKWPYSSCFVTFCFQELFKTECMIHNNIRYGCSLEEFPFYFIRGARFAMPSNSCSLSWVVCKMGSKWPYSSCFVTFCFQELFKTECMIHNNIRYGCSLEEFPFYFIRGARFAMPSNSSSLSWVVCKMGSKWPYSSCFVTFCFQELFKTECMIHNNIRYGCSLEEFPFYFIRGARFAMPSNSCSLSWVVCKMGSKWPYSSCFVTFCFQELFKTECMIHNNIRYGCSLEEFPFYFIRGARFAMPSNSCSLSWVVCKMGSKWPYSSCFVTFCFQELFKTECMIHNNIRYGCSLEEFPFYFIRGARFAMPSNSCSLSWVVCKMGSKWPYSSCFVTFCFQELFKTECMIHNNIRYGCSLEEFPFYFIRGARFAMPSNSSSLSWVVCKMGSKWPYSSCFVTFCFQELFKTECMIHNNIRYGCSLEEFPFYFIRGARFAMPSNSSSLSWVVCKMGSKWPYSSCFVTFCFQELFKTECMIHNNIRYGCSLEEFPFYFIRWARFAMPSNSCSLSWVVCKMGSKWPYSSCFVTFCFQELFKTECMIHNNIRYGCSLEEFPFYFIRGARFAMPSNSCSLSWVVCKMGSKWPYSSCFVTFCFQELFKTECMIHNNIRYGCSLEEFPFYFIRGARFAMPSNSCSLSWVVCKMGSKWPYSSCFVTFCFQELFKTECMIHNNIRYGCSLEEFPFYFIRGARFAMPSNSSSLSWVVCKMGSKWPYSSCFVTFCFQELFKTECMIHNNIRYGCSLEEFPFYFIRGARFAMPSNSSSLSWVVCKMGSKWPYSSCFVTFCFQELFKTECMIHNNIRYGCSLEEFPFYFIRGARFAMPSNSSSLSWVVCKMGSKWPYSSCFVTFCFQELFKTECMIHNNIRYGCSLEEFPFYFIRGARFAMPSNSCSLSWVVCKMGSKWPYSSCFVTFCFQELFKTECMIHNNIRYGCSLEEFPFYFIRGARFAMPSNSCSLSWVVCKMGSKWPYSSCFVTFCFQELFKTECMIHNNIRYGCSLEEFPFYFIRGARFAMPSNSCSLSWVVCKMGSKWPYSSCFVTFCFQELFKTECMIHNNIRYGCSLEEFPFYFIREARFAMPSNSCSLSWVVCKMGSKWPYSSCFVTFCFQELFKTECMIHNNIRYGCSLEEFPFYFIRGARFAMPSNSCSLSWVVCKMGSKWPYSSCFVTFCFQELFKTECMIHNNIRYGCSLEEFPFYFISGARFAMPSNSCSLSWVVCKMGSKWPYSSCFVTFCFQELFKTECMIHNNIRYGCSLEEFPFYFIRGARFAMPSNSCSLSWVVCKMGSKWPYSSCFVTFCFQELFKTECMIHNNIRYGCSLEEFPFYFIRGARFAMPSNSCSLSWVVCKMGSKWPYSSCFVTFCFQELFKTECMIHNNIRYGCSLEEFPFYFIRGARFPYGW